MPVDEVQQDAVRDQLTDFFGKGLVDLFYVQAGADDAPDLGDDARLLGKPQGRLLASLLYRFDHFCLGHAVVFSTSHAALSSQKSKAAFDWIRAIATL